MLAWFLVILVIIVCLAFIGGLFLVLAMILATVPAHFSGAARGNTSFIVKGPKGKEDLKAIWPNVGSHQMSTAEDLDGRHWLVKVNPRKKVRDPATGKLTETLRTEQEISDEVLESFFHRSRRGTLWLQKLLWGRFGFRFVSWFWPQVRVHRFEISRKRLRESAGLTSEEERLLKEGGSKTPLKDRVVRSPESPIVDSLLFTVPRPVYLEGVELGGDNSRINLLLLGVFQQVIPTLPVFYLKGDFFPLLDAAIQAAVVDFFATHRVGLEKVDDEWQFKDDSLDLQKKPTDTYQPSFLTYSHWLKLKKGEGSPLETHLRTLNVSLAYYQKLKKAGKVELLSHLDQLLGDKPQVITGARAQKQMPHGMIPRFGFALVSFRLVDWEAHESTNDLAKALLAKETERHLAEGIRQEASGKGDAFRKQGSGEASRYEALLKALTDKGVKPDVAAEVLRTQVEMEQLHGSGVGTYVRGQAGVMVPASTESSTPSTPPAK